MKPRGHCGAFSPTVPAATPHSRRNGKARGTEMVLRY
jgi:hypothetical protein